MNNLNSLLTLPCGKILKNRIAKSAMSENMGDANYRTTPELVTLYKRWAQGGAGLLITGNVMIDQRALGEIANVVIEENKSDKLLREWGEIAKTNDLAIWVQLNHPGKQSPKFLSQNPVAPSSIPLKAPLDKMFNTPRELGEDEILDLIKRFGYAAGVVKAAGFTGVQIHGAHGYLVSQFLSPRHNQRKDRWGGSLENRMNFVTEVYQSIRKNVGADFPIGIKLNSADFQKGGFSEEESLLVIERLSFLGIDLIEISGGSYESHEMMGANQKESTKKREAYFLDYCEKARAKVSTPLMLTGGFRSAQGMKAALDSGACDVIGLARSMAINPDFPNQILAGLDVLSEVHPLTTGFKFLDQLFPLEITWYAEQLQRMGRGQKPKAKLNAIISIIHSVYHNGLKGLKRVRAK